MKTTKTFLVVLTSMFFATNVTFAKAENENPVQLNRFKDNWFVGVGGGISTYYGNHTHFVPFGRRISPTFNLQLGKWFSPTIGFRGNFAWSNNISADVNAHNPAAYKPYKSVYKTEANFVSMNAETLFNLSNLLLGYNEDRVYSFIPYVGAGWVRNCKSNSDKVAATVGIVNEFKLNKRLALNLDLKASAFGEGLDMVTPSVGKATDMTTSMTVGATYYFGKRNFDRALMSNSEIKQLQEDLKTLNAEKAQLEDALMAARNVQPVEKEIVKQEYASSDVAVFFAINKADLEVKDKVNLRFLADMIKSHSDKTFVITGYADKGTGSAEFNNELSAKRAQTVYDILVSDFNVNARQLEVDHKGGVDNMFFDKKQLSRVAIIRMK